MASSAKSVILYFHGGPGSNSLADEKLLTPILKSNDLEVKFWNEPSQFRPNGFPFSYEGAYTNWMKSAEQFIQENLNESGKVSLVAHSFATIPIMYLAQKYCHSVDQLIFISPITETYRAQNQVVNFAIEDFGRLNDFQSARSLKSMVNKSIKNFDWPMQEALQMAYKDPYLMSHYWSKPEIMDSWLIAQSELGASLDLMSWKAVQEDFASLHIQPRLKEPLPLHAILIFGTDDVVSDREQEINNAHISFKHVTVLNIHDVSHYPHLENPEPFVECLKGEIDYSTAIRIA